MQRSTWVLIGIGFGLTASSILHQPIPPLRALLTGLMLCASIFGTGYGIALAQHRRRAPHHQ